MFFGIKFNVILVTLIVLVLSLLQNISSNLDGPGVAITTSKYKEMDDIRRFNYHTYCKFQANTYRCGNLRTSRRYYYDLKMHTCTTFEYGNCNNSYNMFRGRRDCLSSCRDVAHSAAFTNVTENIFCRFQPDFGECNSYHPMWYFDVADFKCKGFSYSGCGGNYNRFHTSTICAAVCGGAIKN